MTLSPIKIVLCELVDQPDLNLQKGSARKGQKVPDFPSVSLRRNIGKKSLNRRHFTGSEKMGPGVNISMRVRVFILLGAEINQSEHSI